MRDLLITLGHNSSAVVAEGSKLIAGFETERLTHVKSDSAFPTAVISRLNNEHGILVFDKIFVGHWEPHNRCQFDVGEALGSIEAPTSQRADYARVFGIDPS